MTHEDFVTRDVTKLGLGEAQAPPHQTTLQPPQTGIGIGLFALLFWTSCCCNCRLLVCGILYHRYRCPNDCLMAINNSRMAEGTLACLPLGHAAFIAMNHGPSGQKSFSFLGLHSPKPPPELCPWTTLVHQSSNPPVPLAALSGSECLCFSLSLQLCSSNDVSGAWIHGWIMDGTVKKILSRFAFTV